MLSTITTSRRLLAGAALLVAASVVSLQADVSADGAETADSSEAVRSDGCGPVRLKANGTPWTCTFVDDFGGRSLNTNKWGTQQTAQTGFRTGETCFTTSSKNINVRNGELLLTARRESRPIDCSSPAGSFVTPYTGGMVGTRGRFSQAYGRFEVRAKYPTATVPGVHGGFWMYPLNHTYGTWPASGELDIAEWWSSDPTLVLPSLHYTGRDYLVDSGWGCRTSTPSSYHTYTMEWDASVVRFFIDGTECFARTWTPDDPLVAPQPFDQPFSMILNMGSGSTSGSNRVTAETPFPATYTIDYAKAWR